MQQPAASAPTPATNTFAGILAAFASPASKRQPAWNDDDLAEDVATLSYEQAVSAHARYKTAVAGDRLVPPRVDPGSLRIHEAFADQPGQDWTADRGGHNESSPREDSPIARPEPSSDAGIRTYPQAAADCVDESIANRNLKTASITIRLSKAECAQLHQRAREAGLTVSAYLRSCTCEAESLRAMVKETLAELRSKGTSVSEVKPKPAQRGWLRWLSRLWPAVRSSQRPAQA